VFENEAKQKPRFLLCVLESSGRDFFNKLSDNGGSMKPDVSKLIRSGFALATLLLLGACASTHMSDVPEGKWVAKPAPGKALIYFTRPTSFGGAIQATLYDNEDYIGTISANTHVAYQAAPGPHMFMVIGESADFMQANLNEGKTYYARVQPRIGVWKARFSLVPQNGQSNQAEVDGWIKGTREVQVNAEGRQWAKDNAESIKAKKAEYLPKWQEKSGEDKQILHANSGK
jgi:hypothetical protein